METLNLSLFKGYSDITPVNVTLDEILRLVRNDGSVTEAIRKFRYFRSCGNAASASRVKSSCPCFAVAVQFAGGKQNRHIISGEGLRVIYRIDFSALRSGAEAEHFYGGRDCVAHQCGASPAAECAEGGYDIA